MMQTINIMIVGVGGQGTPADQPRAGKDRTDWRL